MSLDKIDWIFPRTIGALDITMYVSDYA